MLEGKLIKKREMETEKKTRQKIKEKAKATRKMQTKTKKKKKRVMLKMIKIILEMTRIKRFSLIVKVLRCREFQSI